MITFPILNQTITINKIAFSLFGIPISWYAVLIVLCLIFAIILFKIRDGLYDIEYNEIITLMLYIIPICFISARLYYVVFKWQYFSQNLLEILNFRKGGLAIYGGIIGGLITCYVFCKKRKISVLDLTDYIVPALALRTSNRKMGELHKHRSIWL